METYWLFDEPTGLTFNNCTLCHTLVMCCLFISEQTATCATYTTNLSVFITEMKSVYSAVRTGSLIKSSLLFVVKGLNTIVLYFHSAFSTLFNYTPPTHAYTYLLHGAESFLRS